MTLKLYYAPGACSFVPHAMLEIAGATFEPMAIRLHKNEQRNPDYLALNARGQVPVLVDGEPSSPRSWPSWPTSTPLPEHFVPRSAGARVRRSAGDE